MSLTFSAFCVLTVLASTSLGQEIVETPKLFQKTTSIKAPFLEQFDADWKSKWLSSRATKVDSGVDNDPILRYNGLWAVEEPKTQLIPGDLGLVLKSQAAHHAIAAKFSSPIEPKDQPLVIQYEVAAQNDLECGGAYMKLLTSNSSFDPTDFDNTVPYTIMFGPDKCGSTNRVHFIFRHQNPITKVWQEKHLKNPPAIKSGKKHNLYTLAINPDQSFELSINNESVKKGSLLEDFDPPVNPPKEIDDVNDTKPTDWVEAAEMVDTSAKKPEDWDEKAPFQIVDENAVKPTDWQDDEPTTIPDPASVKPADWDDEEDGDWIAPTIANPKCQGAVGCGEWSKPMIKNPAYKGPWSAPMIANPAYKGVWKPRTIANPDYFEDLKPSNLASIDAIGFELWTLQNDILFDNIYIGHSIDDARALAAETWVVKSEIENKGGDEIKTNKEADSDKATQKSLVDHIAHEFIRFIETGMESPLEAIKELPHIAGGIALLIFLPVLFLFSPSSSKRAITRKVEDSAKEVSATVEKVAPVIGEKVQKVKEMALDAKEKVQESVDAAIAETEKLKKRAKKAAKSSEEE